MIPYFLQVALFLAASLCFYKLLLQHETFYRINRFLLVACLVLSFALPLVPVPQGWSWQKPAADQWVMPAVTGSKIPASTPQSHSATTSLGTIDQPSLWNKETILQGVVYFYWFGVGAFFINFLAQLIVLIRRAKSFPVIKDGRFRIVEITGDKAPCSFGNYIFINPEKYDWDTYSQILEHEKIHVAQGHTIDLLLIEIALIFQWFNPFAWGYRKALESNLEFLTDQPVIEQPEIEKAAYQLSLVKVSAPHFPLSLTTNYNQSLLKKRVIMMNAKRSNMNATWRYLFLLPVLLGAMCIVNEPLAYGQATSQQKPGESGKEKGIMATEGQWFADIRTNGVQFQFQRDGYTGNGTNGTIFTLEELGTIPRGNEGAFSLTREAGSIAFTGKFDGDKGMGRYRFVPNTEYRKRLLQEGIDLNNDLDQMTFFFVNVKFAYIKELKALGFSTLRKNDLVPLSALDVNTAYILSIQEAGFKNIRLNDLVAFRSLKIDEPYIQSLRRAGYPNLTTDQVIRFKAAGLDQKTINDIRPLTQPVKGKEDHPQPVVGTNVPSDKPNIDVQRGVMLTAADFEAYKNELEEAGLEETPLSKIVQMKTMGITADFVRQWGAAGYKNLRASELMGLKGTGITPEFIIGFQQAGLTSLSVNNALGLKNLGITPALVKEYKELGFTSLSAGNVMGAHATGVTPAFIRAMREKGYNLSLNKYMEMRSTMVKGRE